MLKGERKPLFTDISRCFLFDLRADLESSVVWSRSFWEEAVAGGKVVSLIIASTLRVKTDQCSGWRRPPSPVCARLVSQAPLIFKPLSDRGNCPSQSRGFRSRARGTAENRDAEPTPRAQGWRGVFWE